MQTDFTQGSIEKKLLVFAFPIMLAMLLQTAFNVIDAVFVGMLGSLELAAVSVVFPVFFVFIAVASGLGIGANALISQAIGRKNIHEANNIAEHALFLGFVSGILISFFGIVFSPVLFVFMGADENVLPLAIQYSVPLFFGTVFLFAWFISDAILKAQGNSKTPLKSLAFSLLLDIVLAPILIFGLLGVPALGLFGAALATVISRIVAAIINFYYIYTPKSVISLALREFRPFPQCIKEMLAIGLPASATQTLSAAGFVLLTSIVGSYGSFALAAFGIGLRVNSIVILPVLGVSSAVIAFAGQNVGAKNFDRARKVALFATRITLLFSLLLVFFLFSFPEQIIRVFSSDITVVGIAKTYLSIVPFAFLFYGFYFVLIAAFQGAGRTVLALATNIAYWVATIAIAFLLSPSLGLKGVWLAIVIAAGIELVFVSIIFWSGFWLKPRSRASN